MLSTIASFLSYTASLELDLSTAECLATLTTFARTFRNGCGYPDSGPTTQCSLAEAHIPTTLCTLLKSEVLLDSPVDASLPFRRMVWQALSNMCSGPGGQRGVVLEAVLARDREGGVSALEVGATCSAIDPALGGVVVGLVYTACGCGCVWGDGEGAEEAASASLLQVIRTPRAFNALLRLLLPPTTTPTGGAEDHHYEAASWGALLGGAILQCGLLKEALVTASMGLQAGELMGVAKGVEGGGAQLKITGEVTALLCAVEAVVEEKEGAEGGGGVGGTSGGGSAPLHTGLMPAIPALCECIKLSSAEALGMAQLITAAGSSSTTSTNLIVDTGPQCLLPKLHLGLCLRVGEACAALLAEALAVRVACMEDRGGSVPPLATTAAAGAMAGTPTALLSLLAAATPLISSAAAPPPPSPPPVDTAGGGGGGVSAGAAAKSGAAATPSHIDPSLALFSRRLPPPVPPTLRPALTRALANCLYGEEGETARREALEVGGVPVLLAQTKMEEGAFLLREWALLGIKHWCEGGGEAAQRAIVAVQGVREGVSPEGVARELPKCYS